MGKWQRVAQRAEGQLGLVTTRQAALEGVSRQVLHVKAAEQGWQRVLRGVYLLPGHTLGPLTRIKAVELALGDAAVVAGHAAAFVWGLERRPAGLVDVLVPTDRAARVPGARVRRSRQIQRLEATSRKGIRLTTPAWTACTLGATLGSAELADRIATGHRLRLLTPGGVARAVEALGRFTGRANVVRALEALDGRLAHSGLEHLGRDVLEEAGFEPYPWPYPVEHQGELIAELDIALPGDMVGIPIDGPHHLLADQKRADEDQRLRLRAAGWEIVVADEVRLRDQPQVFVRQVHDAVARQRARRSVAQRGRPSGLEHGEIAKSVKAL